MENTKNVPCRGVDGSAVSIGGKMTILDAVTLYHNYGAQLHGFYDDMYEHLIANRSGAMIPNSDYLHALQLTSLMLRKAKNNFCMLAGGCTDDFIKLLEEDFCGMLKRFRAENKEPARLIVVNARVEMPTLRKLSTGFPTTLKVVWAHAKQEAKVSHYIVADNMVRVEQPHPQLTNESPADVIKAEVYFDDKPRADFFREQFGSLEGMLAQMTPAA